MPGNEHTFTETDPAPDEELAFLRQRLAWFESFDALMKKSVGNAGDILREAIDLREAVTRERDQALSSANQQHAEALRGYRELFSEMLDDITQLQGHAERLARRLADAIDALEAELQPEVAFPSLPSSLTAEIASSVEGPADGPVESVELELGNERTSESDSPKVISVNDALTPEAEADDAVVVNAENESLSLNANALTDEASSLPAANGLFILLVHGVPRAATALNLKTYLESLDIVEQVEPREFAAGLLRLQLKVSRELQEQDLEGWVQAGTLTALHSRAGLLEVRLT